MRIFWIIVAIIVIVIAGYYLFFRPSGTTTSPTPSPAESETYTPTPTPTPSTSATPKTSGTSTIFQMNEQNSSGETGTVTLTPVGTTQTKVIINVTNEPTGVSQPAHIHIGTCANLGAIKYSLANVINGKSTTTLNITIAKLKTMLPLAVNAHESAANINTYVSCANLNLQ